MSERSEVAHLREFEIRAQARETARTTYEAIRRVFERAPQIVNGPVPSFADDLPYWEALEPEVREMIVDDLTGRLTGPTDRGIGGSGEGQG